jgi:hypothetical protein
MQAKSWLRRLEGAASGHLEYFDLLDGSRYGYDRLETAKELFLHSIDCLRLEYEEGPELPEVYLKIRQAKDVRGVLERFVPSGNEAWFIDLPYDREVLILERRLLPGPHKPVKDLSES